MEEVNTESKKKVNIWKVITIIEIVIVTILLVIVFIKGNNKDWKDKVCDRVNNGEIGTPSWFDKDGNLIVSSFIPLFEEKNNQIITKYDSYLVRILEQNNIFYSVEDIGTENPFLYIDIDSFLEMYYNLFC